LRGVTIVKPIVIGNTAKYFGKKREEDGHTHQWTVYLKPYLNEDYSIFIKKVHFKLHDSYANPNRIVTKPPYEVSETGWGEFEVVIKIHFNDPLERPVTVYHILKLFQPGTDPTTPAVVKKNLVSEFYDEIVFQEPTLLTKSLIDSIKPMTTGAWKHEVDFEDKKKASAAAIAEARGKVKVEIQDLKEKLKIAKETIAALKEAVANVQRENNDSNPSSSTATKTKSSVTSEPVAGTSKALMS
jgi:YEATS domain-containing protein 4